MKFPLMSSTILSLGVLALGSRLVACSAGDSETSPSSAVAGAAGAGGSTGGAGVGAGGSGAGNGGAGNGGAGNGGAGTTGKGGAGTGAGGGGAGKGGSAGAAGGAGTGSAGAGMGGCAGMGTSVVPSPACDGTAGGTITYYALDACGWPVAHTQGCPGGCELKGTSATCTNAPPGEAPFRTCATASDCGTTTRYCTDDKHSKLLGSPQCNEGRCDWATSELQTCTASCMGATGACAGTSAGGQGGAGGGQTSSGWFGEVKGSCNGDLLVYSYMTGSAGMTSVMGSYPCKKGCVQDATGAHCAPAADEVPRYTCGDSIACPGIVSTCSSSDPSVKTTWKSPTCVGAMCTWAYSVTKACLSATMCIDEPCPG